MSIVTAYKKKEQKQERFLQYIVHFVNPVMWILTFNVILGYQGLLFRDFLWFFFRNFFSNPTDRPNIRKRIQRKKKKKKGMALAYV